MSVSVTYSDIDDTAGGTVVFTASGETAITFASFTNLNASTAKTVDLYLVPTSGTAIGDSYAMAKAYSINGGDTWQIYAGGEKLLLPDGYTLKAIAESGATFTGIVSSTTI